MLSSLRTATRRSLAIILFCLAWEVLPRTGLVDRVFLPPLSEVLNALHQLALSGALATNTIASVLRASAGLALAILLGVPAGLVIGSSRRIAEFIGPLLEVFRNTAPLALLPVFTLILGIGETSKIAMVLYASSWPILLSTVNGVRTVDPLLVKAARAMGLGSVRLFAKVILPASVPTIFTGIRLAAAHSILVLIAAEMVGAKAGLGYFVNAAEFNFQIPQMYAGILMLSALGLLANFALVRIENRLSAWRTP
ncbi:MAG TPA: ABC transporter permease [Stellaceae bacterium]|nr:ABC transporter permease [Stellaceae bacterium]